MAVVIEEKSTFSDPDDLLDKIRLFLLANGWTIDLWEADMGIDYYGPDLDGLGVDTPDEFYHRLHVSKGDLYYSMHSVLTVNPHTDQGGSLYNRAMKNGICLVGCDDHDPAEPWDEQPGTCLNLQLKPNSCFIPELPVGNSTYWFFLGTAPDAFYCIAEVAPDEFRHLCFGELEKPYVWDGGSFFCASMNRFRTPSTGEKYYLPPMGIDTGITEASQGTAGGLRVNYDSFDKWLGNPENASSEGTNCRTGLGYVSSLIGTYSWYDFGQDHEWYNIHRVPNYGEISELDSIADNSFNSANQLSCLLPINLYGRRLPLDSHTHTLLGRLPHCHFVNIRNVDIDTVYSYGSAVYRVMATHSKYNARDEAVVRFVGLAFEVAT